MYYLNKTVGAVLNPMGIAMILIGFGLILAWRRRAIGTVCAVLGIAWLWFWASGISVRLCGQPLEREFPSVAAEKLPEAGAIFVLGGGMGVNTNECAYAEMWAGADRAWHGARLYRAGRAPKVIVSGGETAEAGTMPLLADLGVPRSAVVFLERARNTEEEARQVTGLLGDSRRILLVTSAWHMRRAKLMFEKFAKGVEVIPAACDYESLVSCQPPLEFQDFLPSADALSRSSFVFKEIIAYWGYRLFR